MFHSHNATCIFPQFELQLILASVAPPPPALPLQTQATVSSRCAECDERNGTASANPQSLACSGDVEGAQLVFCLFFHEQFVMRAFHLQMASTVVLRTLQHLRGAPALRALALRLATAVWRRQVRCFPHLQQLLRAGHTRDVSLTSGVDEVALAKMATICDVCEFE